MTTDWHFQPCCWGLCLGGSRAFCCAVVLWSRVGSQGTTQNFGPLVVCGSLVNGSTGGKGGIGAAGGVGAAGAAGAAAGAVGMVVWVGGNHKEPEGEAEAEADLLLATVIKLPMKEFHQMAVIASP